MVGKVVKFEKGYRVKIKFLFWFYDPGFPTFDYIDDVKEMAYTNGIKIKLLKEGE